MTDDEEFHDAVMKLYGETGYVFICSTEEGTMVLSNVTHEAAVQGLRNLLDRLEAQGDNKPN